MEPTPQPTEWKFIHTDGRIYGPMGTEKVLELCRGRVIRTKTGVHSTLFGQWVEAGTLGALRQAMAGAGAAGNEPLKDLPFEVPPLLPVVKTQRSDKATSLAILVLFVGAITVGLLNFALNPLRETDVAARIGGAIMSIGGVFISGFLLGWLFSLIGYLGGSYRRGLTQAGLWFGIGLTVLSGVAGECTKPARRPGASVSRAVQAKRDADMKELVAAAVQQSESPSDQRLAVKSPSELPAGADQHERIMQAARALMNDMLAVRDTYLHAIESLELADLVRPPGQPGAISSAEAASRLKRARAALHDYEWGVRQANTQLSRRLDEFGVDSSTTSEMLIGFKLSFSRNQKLFDQIVANEERTLELIESLRRQMDLWGQRVRFVDGRLEFSSRNDRELYEETFREIQEVSAEQDRLRNQMLQKVSTSMGN